LAKSGDASRITVAETAKGSTITASKHYKFEVIFTEGDTVEDLMKSGFFGDQEIRVVRIVDETLNIKEEYLLKLDGEFFSTVYQINKESLEDNDKAISSLNGKFLIDTVNGKVSIDGDVTGEELRDYLQNNSNSLFNIASTFNEGKVVMSYYDIANLSEELYPSLPQHEDHGIDRFQTMRALVGTDKQHGLYILTKKSVN
jgi:hypothetical protein